MSTDEQIRTTLRQTADAAEAPSIDQIGFEQRVRWHRRRRRAGLAGATAAVAAVALAVPLAVSQIGSDTRTGPASTTAASPDPNRPPIYFTTNGDRVLTPDGVIHEVTDGEGTDGYSATAIGLTPDGGAILNPHDGGLVRLQVVGRDPWRFERISLSDEVFGLGAASEDGRYFAAESLAGDVVIYDLSTNQEVRRVPTGSGWVADYSDRGVLWSRGWSYWLGFGPDRLEIPVTNHAERSARAEAGGDIVAIGDPRPMTQLYDVSGGTARPIGMIEGHGALSPDGRYYLSPIQEEPGYAWKIQKPLTLWERDSDASRAVTGLDDGAGTVRDIAWLDADTATVLTRIPDRSTIWTCEASTRQCEEVHAFASTPGGYSWLVG